MVDMPAGSEEQIYSIEQFEADVEKIAQFIKAGGRKFTHVYSLPRGGSALALWLSHRLNLRFADISFFPKLEIESLTLKQAEPGLWVRDIIPRKDVVVVDDISDSGKQLKKFKDAGFFIATLFRKPGTMAEPDIWIHTKYEKWIRFPWEKEELK